MRTCRVAGTVEGTGTTTQPPSARRTAHQKSGETLSHLLALHCAVRGTGHGTGGPTRVNGQAHNKQQERRPHPPARTQPPASPTQRPTGKAGRCTCHSMTLSSTCEQRRYPQHLECACVRVRAHQPTSPSAPNGSKSGETRMSPVKNSGGAANDNVDITERSLPIACIATRKQPAVSV